MSDGRPGWLSGYRRDYYGGALMILIGLSAAIQGTKYQVGTLTRMGSGFFPVALGVILALIGAAIAATARQPGGREAAQEGVLHQDGGGPEWRGWFCILASVAAFAILGRWGGLVPATFAITFISALGDRDNSWRAACVLALIMTAICVGVFWWALQIQLPLFTWG